MNNNSYWNKSNLLKGIGTLCIFIIFGYYAYQDAINRMKTLPHRNVTLPTNLLDYNVRLPYMEIQFIRMWLEKLRM